MALRVNVLSRQGSEGSGWEPPRGDDFRVRAAGAHAYIESRAAFGRLLLIP